MDDLTAAHTGYFEGLAATLPNRNGGTSLGEVWSLQPDGAIVAFPTSEPQRIAVSAIIPAVFSGSGLVGTCEYMMWVRERRETGAKRAFTLVADDPNRFRSEFYLPFARGVNRRKHIRVLADSGDPLTLIASLPDTLIRVEATLLDISAEGLGFALRGERAADFSCARWIEFDLRRKGAMEGVKVVGEVRHVRESGIGIAGGVLIDWRRSGGAVTETAFNAVLMDIQRRRLTRT